MVSTPYIGVSPADIENLVTIPLENELAGLTDINEDDEHVGGGLQSGRAYGAARFRHRTND